MREAVVAILSDEPDIHIVGEISDAEKLSERIEQLRPDVLVIALDEHKELLSQCGFLLGRYPEMRVLAVSPEGNRSVLYWAAIDIRNKPVEHSGQGLLNAMRESPSWMGAPDSLGQELR